MQNVVYHATGAMTNDTPKTAKMKKMVITLLQRIVSPKYRLLRNYYHHF